MLSLCKMHEKPGLSLDRLPGYHSPRSANPGRQARTLPAARALSEPPELRDDPKMERPGSRHHLRDCTRSPRGRPISPRRAPRFGALTFAGSIIAVIWAETRGCEWRRAGDRQSAGDTRPSRTVGRAGSLAELWTRRLAPADTSALGRGSPRQPDRS